MQKCNNIEDVKKLCAPTPLHLPARIAEKKKEHAKKYIWLPAAGLINR